ncbi:MAG: hypothetical protein ACREAY_04300 [Nitrososphaera sp.]|uniref:hypothetical protein n=1 Tax=Nitrososphaera sp. TaxID=1971748 RepID=UPI003D6ECB14
MDTAGITDFSPSLGKVAADSLALGDSTRPDGTAKDAVALSDSPSIQANVFHPLAASDTVALADLSPSLDRIAKDNLLLKDSARLDNSPRDVMALSESVSVQTGVFNPAAATDTVAIRDGTRPDSAPRDTVSLSESTSMQTNVHWDVTASDVVALSDARSLSRSATETVLLADSTALPSLATSSVVSIADAASRVSVVKKQALDSIAAADAISIGPGIKIGETVSITETVEVRPSAIYIFDSLAASDGVGAPRERGASDNLSLDDAIVASRGAVINESIVVSDQFGGVSVHWSRNYAESFTLQDCTPFACNQVLHFGESMALGGAFSPPLL